MRLRGKYFNYKMPALGEIWAQWGKARNKYCNKLPVG